MEHFENSREEKMLFLKKEIVDLDYSPDEFTEYCEKIKGADLDLWNLSDLSDCVKNFKETHQNNHKTKDSVESSESTGEIINEKVEVFNNSSSKLDDGGGKDAVVLDSTLDWKDKDLIDAPYSHTAIKSHDNLLSLEDSVTVRVGK